jgi:tetratricopeptide (TPR) repeat protein
VDIETCVAPAENLLQQGKTDELFPKQEGEDLMGEDFLDELVMETTDMVKGTIRGCASFGHQTVNVRMEIDAIAEGLDHGHHCRHKLKACSCLQEFHKCAHRRETERIEKLNPFPIFCQHQTGLAHISQGDLAGARQSSTNIRQYVQEQGLEDFFLSFASLLEGAIHAAEKNGPAVLETIEKCAAIHKQGPEFIRLSAEAGLLMNNLELAAEHFQRLKSDISMSRYGNDASFFFRCSSLTDYNLGRVYEKMGNAVDAREHYEKFLSLWKDADPGLPEVDDAKERLAGLKK